VLRKKLALLLVAAMMSVLMVCAPAFAQPHEGHLCEAPNHPGHTEYTEHHIVLLAQEQGLGAGHEGGHVPGHHQGYAGLCGVLAPEV
jgi:hypothetical protein